jgi:hypothetical protein
LVLSCAIITLEGLLAGLGAQAAAPRLEHVVGPVQNLVRGLRVRLRVGGSRLVVRSFELRVRGATLFPIDVEVTERFLLLPVRILPVRGGRRYGQSIDKGVTGGWEALQPAILHHRHL